MSPDRDADEPSLDGLSRDAACPMCEYNLRGLRGDPVTCPECGGQFSVRKLIECRWEKPWYKAPGFTRACGPAVGFMLGFLISIVFLVLLLSTGSDAGDVAGGLVLIAILLGTLAGFYVAQDVFPGGRGIGLAAVSLVIAASYLCGAFTLLGGLLGFIGSVASDGASAAFSLLFLLLGVALIYVGRRTERYIATRCIHAYLRRSTMRPD